MAEPRMVGSCQYVNRSYQDVCALLRRAPLDVLQRATTSASARTKSLATSLVDLVEQICSDLPSPDRVRGSYG